MRAASSLASAAVPAPARHAAGGTLARGGVRRAALLAGVAVAVAAAIGLAQAAPPTRVDPELARLLRFMALLKGLAVVGVLALLVGRLGRPLASRAAAGYLLGAWTMAAACACIAQLAFLPAAAGLFHLGLALLLLAAFRDGSAFRATWGA